MTRRLFVIRPTLRNESITKDGKSVLIMKGDKSSVANDCQF